jgi:hypothetical protein
LSFRLNNQKDPSQVLIISTRAWYNLLQLAEKHGWCPMGTILPDWLMGMGLGKNGSDFDGIGYDGGTYTPQTSRLVNLDDALNLADALERIFLTLEPTPVYPQGIVLQADWEEPLDQSLPGVGVLVTLTEFCRQGAFHIERSG